MTRQQLDGGDSGGSITREEMQARNKGMPLPKSDQEIRRNINMRIIRASSAVS